MTGTTFQLWHRERERDARTLLFNTVLSLRISNVVCLRVVHSHHENVSWPYSVESWHLSFVQHSPSSQLRHFSHIKSHLDLTRFFFSVLTFSLFIWKGQNQVNFEVVCLLLTFCFGRSNVAWFNIFVLLRNIQWVELQAWCEFTERRQHCESEFVSNPFPPFYSLVEHASPRSLPFLNCSWRHFDKTKSLGSLCSFDWHQHMLFIFR